MIYYAPRQVTPSGPETDGPRGLLAGEIDPTNRPPERRCIILNYDWNIHDAIQTVEVTIQNGEFQTKLTTKVYGNCKGMTILERAVWNVFEDLFRNVNDHEVELELKNPAGDTLLVEVAEEDEDEFHNMVVKVEIVDIVSDPN